MPANMPWYLYLALKQLFPTGKKFPFFTAISVLGVALTVALLGHAALQRNDFDALYLLHGALALLTGLLCLPVDTRPRAAPHPAATPEPHRAPTASEISSAP